LKKIQSDQKALNSLASKASSVVSTVMQVVKDIVKYQLDEARAAYVESLGGKDSEAGKKFLDEKDPEKQLAAMKDFQPYKDTKTIVKNWESGGNYNLALQAVTTVVVGSVAGQNDAQIAANALTPYATQLIGEQFGPVGSNPDVALNVLSRAVLGAVLAEVNGRDPVAGAVSTSGELALRYLIAQLYERDLETLPSKLTSEQLKKLTGLSLEEQQKLLSEGQQNLPQNEQEYLALEKQKEQALDKLKSLSPTDLQEWIKLTPDKLETLTALAQATGALAGGLTGDSINQAASGLSVAKDALANISKKPVDKK
jgi:filamentous hemagglutinin